LTALLTASAIAFATDSGLELSLTLVVAFDAIVLALMVVWKAYAPRLRLDVLDDVRTVVTAAAVGAMAAGAIDAAFSPTEPSIYDTLRLWALAVTSLVLSRSLSITVVKRQRARWHAGATTIIIGAGQVGRLTARRLLEHPEFGLHPIGFVDKDPVEIRGREAPLPVLGASWDIEDIVRAFGVDCAVITFSNAPHDVLLSLLDECARLGVRALVVPRLFERVPAKVEVSHVGALPLLEHLPTNPHSVQYAVKYALDRVAAVLLIVVLSPVLLAVTVAVWLSLGRPILFGQERVGMDERHFRMLKFRTMLPPSKSAPHILDFVPESGPGGVEGADRRTRVGAFLRKSSLDELAQLFNVLVGQMSLVGPRPERPEYVEYFGEHVRRYEARHRVKSGITGWAQIHRLRGKTSIADRVEWDNYYIENFSLWLDLKIMLRTVPEVLRGGTE
ncbi:MAG: sugar transferase, partial [Thermoleophilia bacterium]|nr:sugar transferase [Thermoleophilia bacterium]